MFANNSKKSRQQMTHRNNSNYKVKSHSGKQSYRSTDYRQQYFKKNPGLLGKIHFCYYCGKPLIKKYVEVDHILPVSKSHINSTFNLAASCRKCNRSKSDKVNHLVVVGFGRKLAGNILGIPFKVAGFTLTNFFKLGTQGKFVVVCMVALAYYYFLGSS